ncbi:MAG: F0F1 ATP synthase subunit delta [Patescibacteria group bacterium]
MSQTKLAQIIDQQSSGSDIAEKIASYLVDTKQTLKLDSLMRDVTVARETRGVFEVSVASAHEIGQSQISSIKDYIKKKFPSSKEVIIHTKVDPSLLGGLRIESANYLMDQSLKSKLNYIKSTIDN